MEATGRDGGAGGSSWSYRRRHEEIGASSDTISSSSRSGTIVSSSAYTSGASCLSSGICMEAADWLELESELRLGTPEPEKMEPDKKFSGSVHSTLFQLQADDNLVISSTIEILDPPLLDMIVKSKMMFAQSLEDMMKAEHLKNQKRMERTERLVLEFFGTPSANRSNEGGDMKVLERWFTDLGVSWVFQLDVGASASVLGRHPEDETMIWIRALTKIMETIRLTESFFPDPEVDSGKESATSKRRKNSSLCVQQSSTGPDPLQFALFFQQALAKMLVFVDVMFTIPISSCREVISALSEVLLKMRLQFHSSHPAEVEKIEKEMVSILLAKQGKVFDAIWSIMENRLRAKAPQGSSDLHPATWSIMNHIKFVSHKVSSLEEAQRFVSMTTGMLSCLEEKLITKSQSILDKGLGLLFLLNNSNYIREKLQDSLSHIAIDLAAVITRITSKVEHFAESYIQVSWEPMLACLSNPTPLCLVRKYSPLSKFESEFQETYSTQIQWKVPDPELKKRLRKAIIEKIIPGYTKYIEDSNVSNPKFTPQELEEKLQELFEG